METITPDIANGYPSTTTNDAKIPQMLLNNQQNKDIQKNSTESQANTNGYQSTTQKTQITIKETDNQEYIPTFLDLYLKYKDNYKDLSLVFNDPCVNGFLINIICLIGTHIWSYDSQYPYKMITTFLTSYILVFIATFYLIYENLYIDKFKNYRILISIAIPFAVYAITFLHFQYFIYICLFLAILGKIISVFTQNSTEFNASITKLVCKWIFKDKTFVSVLVFTLFLYTLFSFMMILSSWAFWDFFLWTQLYLLVSYLITTGVIANIVYMISSYYTAKIYFTKVNEITKSDYFGGIKRILLYNIGDAFRCALHQPVFGLVNSLAKLDVINQGIFVNSVRNFGLRLKEKLNQRYGYHSRKALVYCALFEDDYNFARGKVEKKNIFEKFDKNDMILSFRTLCFGIAVAQLTNAIGPRFPRFGLSYSRGFVLVFGYFYIIRSMMKGFSDTIFMLFNDIPENADVFRDGLTHELTNIIRPNNILL
ncbi:hypothetical protein TVAG_185620 [Trichomonas vaginalis G3]|uniref:Uncharacterized protein n=1 Tax=Trichomonas vaginalis (strain ATCC PRA-98 / G3) TaxID=412133 RepID=A2D8K6_TRIV3|nr:choline transporter-like (SLC family 44) family [Trichomonas vaginalis G3]EAY23255.1 hypothetical protein TVAG_185620 [Trichomonas vaginalis G3]KAI5534096.1 choline transporter-like (SLC family 44) family [Trichomonas vaginalis G3]|eukprot:XP_001584241.1 hypothetical protein [Trichomonas vaginalis G3]